MLTGIKCTHHQVFVDVGKVFTSWTNNRTTLIIALLGSRDFDQLITREMSRNLNSICQRFVASGLVTHVPPQEKVSETDFWVWLVHGLGWLQNIHPCLYPSSHRAGQRKAERCDESLSNHQLMPWRRLAISTTYSHRITWAVSTITLVKHVGPYLSFTPLINTSVHAPQ